jgi:hypothetical protein
MARQRANHRGLRHAGKPQQQDGLAVVDGAEQQMQLRATPDNVTCDVVR